MCRYRRDAAALTDWMDEAKERLHGWTVSITSEEETDKALSQYKEFIVSSAKFYFYIIIHIFIFILVFILVFSL